MMKIKLPRNLTEMKHCNVREDSVNKRKKSLNERDDCFLRQLIVKYYKFAPEKRT